MIIITNNAPTVTILHGQITSPDSTALSAFQSLHAADVAGGNIRNLVTEYNALLNQPANTSDIGFQQINNQAVQAQTYAVQTRNMRNIFIIILVPIIATILALLSVLVVSISRRVRKKKLLEMRILD
jgi:hypothetical protein